MNVVYAMLECPIDVILICLVYIVVSLLYITYVFYFLLKIKTSFFYCYCSKTFFLSYVFIYRIKNAFIYVLFFNVQAPADQPTTKCVISSVYFELYYFSLWINIGQRNLTVLVDLQTCVY